MATLALIGLGSNVGDRKAHLDRAVTALAEKPGVSVVSVSTYHETTPAGGPAGQGAFLNAAARLTTDLDPFALLRVLHDIEAQSGRVRTVRWGERSLDLDLLIYGTKRLDTPELTLPHPRLNVRRFVLAPLAEIAPHIVDVRSGTDVEGLLAILDRRPSYLSLDGPPGPSRDEIFRGLVAGLPSVGLTESSIAPGPEPSGPGDAALWFHPRWSAMSRAKLRRLITGDLRKELHDGRWLVSDFLVDPDQTASDPFFDGPVPLRDDQSHPLLRWWLEPTIVVALHGGALRAGQTQVILRRIKHSVVLIPDSIEIHGIVHEILAACAASRA